NWRSWNPDPESIFRLYICVFAPFRISVSATHPLRGPAVRRECPGPIRADTGRAFRNLCQRTYLPPTQVRVAENSIELFGPQPAEPAPSTPTRHPLGSD